MRLVIIKIPHLPEIFCEKTCALAERLEYEIAGIVSIEKNPATPEVKGYPVLPLIKIFELKWDAVIVACEDKNFFKKLVPELVKIGIGSADKFKSMLWLLKQFMMLKYEDFPDPVIQETLEYWRTHTISIFNQHLDLGNGVADRVFFDEDCNLSFIYFKTIGGDYRKMYFPRETKFETRDGERFIVDILLEQRPTSPHIYTTKNHHVQPGDILIDAGVCEGNFALRYVDICPKLYLFESDAKWIEPLSRTFKDYRDKVEIIPRFVSDFTDDKNITLDDALPNLRGKNIFLKMDIEGAEPLALRGAKNLLTNNKVRASVCTYHNADDLIKVKSIFRQYGFRTATSAGYMVFFIDPKIFDTADFRKGIVYAAN